MGVRIAAFLLLSTLAFGCAVRREGTRNRVEPSKAFLDQVQTYMKMHEELEKQVPPVKDKSSPQQIAAHEDAFAKLIQAKRAGARQGEIFVPESQPFFREIMKASFKGPLGPENKATVKEGNPKFEGPAAQRTKVAVNAAYPKDAPVSTVPPLMLQKLPKLPEELEYRFVGRNLILRDAHANLVVDYLPEVVPK